MVDFRLVNNIHDLGFEYEQRSGMFYLADCQNVRMALGAGYSGKGACRDKPECEERKAYGPIPRGLWRLGSPVTHPTLGPVSIPLTFVAEDGQQSPGPFGRSGFYIHGDNKRGNGTASTGCIVLDRTIRDFVARSGLRTLVVV